MVKFSSKFASTASDDPSPKELKVLTTHSLIRYLKRFLDVYNIFTLMPKIFKNFEFRFIYIVNA